MRVENHSDWPQEEGDPAGAIKRAIRAQEETGCHIVTDGHPKRPDLASRLAGNFDEVVSGGADSAFPRPVARGRIAWKGPLTVDDFRDASRLAKRDVKAVLTGPVTLARHTVIGTDAYPDAEALVADYAGGLLDEARALFAAGATALQIDEPSILSHPEDLPVLKRFLGDLAKAKPPDAVVGLATWGADAAPLYLKLLELPVGALVWDLPASETLEELVSRGFSKVLGLGIVDARTAEPEKPEDVARRVERIAKKARGEVRLLPSRGLSRLAPDAARRKIGILARAWTFLEG